MWMQVLSFVFLCLAAQSLKACWPCDAANPPKETSSSTVETGPPHPDIHGTRTVTNTTTTVERWIEWDAAQGKACVVIRTTVVVKVEKFRDAGKRRPIGEPEVTSEVTEVRDCRPIPADQDCDEDGIPDLQEVELGTDPCNPDTDGDGLSDGDELERGTDPLDDDSDNDTEKDGDEVAQGFDPRDPLDRPSHLPPEVKELALRSRPNEPELPDGTEIPEGGEGCDWSVTWSAIPIDPLIWDVIDTKQDYTNAVGKVWVASEWDTLVVVQWTASGTAEVTSRSAGDHHAKIFNPALSRLRIYAEKTGTCGIGWIWTDAESNFEAGCGTKSKTPAGSMNAEIALVRVVRAPDVNDFEMIHGLGGNIGASAAADRKINVGGYDIPLQLGSGDEWIPTAGSTLQEADAKSVVRDNATWEGVAAVSGQARCNGTAATPHFPPAHAWARGYMTTGYVIIDLWCVGANCLERETYMWETSAIVKEQDGDVTIIRPSRNVFRKVRPSEWGEPESD